MTEMAGIEYVQDKLPGMEKENMTSETDPIARAVAQYDSIITALRENMQLVLTTNLRKEDRIRDLETLVRLYADPFTSSDPITQLRRKLGV